MPNYCMNKIVFWGDDGLIADLKTKVKSEESLFDFNRIIPMPDEVRNTEHGSVSFASEAAALYLIDGTINNHLRWMMERYDVGVTELEATIESWESQGKVDLSMGKRIIANREHFQGCGDWYEWAIENWGTKWEASEVTVSNNMVTFETAWSPSVPVVERLSSMFEELTIEYKYFEPGIGLAGVEVYQSGTCLEMQMFDVDDINYRALEQEFVEG
jgi:hypothetical protein